jgi:hypothetical protein
LQALLRRISEFEEFRQGPVQTVRNEALLRISMIELSRDGSRRLRIRR